VFRSNAQLIESDLFGTIEVLAQIANTRNPPEGLVQLVDMIKVGRFHILFFMCPTGIFLVVSSRVVDPIPHHLDADPDPNFQIKAQTLEKSAKIGSCFIHFVMSSAN
jgi:hypothetical protein